MLVTLHDTVPATNAIQTFVDWLAADALMSVRTIGAASGALPGMPQWFRLHLLENCPDQVPHLVCRPVLSRQAELHQTKAHRGRNRGRYWMTLTLSQTGYCWVATHVLGHLLAKTTSPEEHTLERCHSTACDLTISPMVDMGVQYLLYMQAANNIAIDNSG